MTSLADIIIYKDLKQLKSHVNKDTDLNVIDEYGFTPLTEAAVMNKTDMALYLLEQGADANFADTTGRSALHWACDNANLTLCQALLKQGANANCYTDNGQAALVLPLLRQQKAVKDCLVAHGANIDFALSYVYAKLIGHRYALKGQVHIITPRQNFAVVNFEGFLLEFTLLVIADSLQAYQHNFASRVKAIDDTIIQQVTTTLRSAAQLSAWQHYQTDIKQQQTALDHILKQQLLLLPVVYEGHAITFIKYDNLFVKCDRGANSKKEGSINIYNIGNTKAANSSLWQQILYEKQKGTFIHEGLKQVLQLTKVDTIPMPAQITGNCSWANTEAAVPVMLALLLKKTLNKEQSIASALELFTTWRTWDKSRALSKFIKRYDEADEIGRASIVSVLTAVCFQMLQDDDNDHASALEKIRPILRNPKLFYITNCYLKQFNQKHPTEAGRKLQAWLTN